MLGFILIFMQMQSYEQAFQKEPAKHTFERNGTAFFSAVVGLLFLTMTFFYYREYSVLVVAGVTKIALIGNVSVIGGIILGVVYFLLASLSLAKPNRNVFLVSAIFSGVMSILSFSLQVLPSSVTSYTTLYYLTFFNGYQLAISVIGVIAVFLSLQAFRSYRFSR